MFPVKKIIGKGQNRFHFTRFRIIPSYRTIAERNADNARYVKLPRHKFLSKELPMSVFSSTPLYRGISKDSSETKDSSSAATAIVNTFSLHPEGNSETRRKDDLAPATSSKIVTKNVPSVEQDRIPEFGRCIQSEIVRFLRMNKKKLILSGVQKRLQKIDKQEQMRMLQDLRGEKNIRSALRLDTLLTPSTLTTPVIRTTVDSEFGSNQNSPTSSILQPIRNSTPTFNDAFESLPDSDLLRTPEIRKDIFFSSPLDSMLDILDKKSPIKIHSILTLTATNISENDRNGEFINHFLKSLNANNEIQLPENDEIKTKPNSTISSLSRKRNSIENDENKNQLPHNYDICFKGSLNLKLSPIDVKNFSPIQSKICGKRSRQATGLVDLHCDLKPLKRPRQ